jgi:hypothetical protein
MWEQAWYVDVAVAFGLRHGASFAQRVSTAVCDILAQEEHAAIPYIDDFVGASPSRDKAAVAFDRSAQLFAELGLQEAEDKCVPPSTQLTWIGVNFNTATMEMTIPPSVIAETADLVQSWLHKSRATRHDLQVIMGKLFHSAKCAPPARLFVGRMLATLRAAPPTGTIQLSEEFKKDLLWFSEFLPSYNGVAIIHQDREAHNIHIHSTTTQGSVQWEAAITHTPLPATVAGSARLAQHHDMFMLWVALSLWGHRWTGALVLVHVDNAKKIDVLLHGKTHDLGLLDMARLVWLVSARFDIQLTPCDHSLHEHLPIPSSFCHPPSLTLPAYV